MNRINNSISELSKTRLLVTLIFLVYTVFLIAGTSAFTWNIPLVEKAIEHSSFLCLLYVAGKSATDWVAKMTKNGNGNGNGGNGTADGEER